MDLTVTEDRRQLYDQIVTEQRQSSSGRLSSADTFDLYKTFMAVAEADEAAGRQQPHDVLIDSRVDEQRFIDLQLAETTGAYTDPQDFRRIDGYLPDVESTDVDYRSRGHTGPIESRTTLTGKKQTAWQLNNNIW